MKQCLSRLVLTLLAFNLSMPHLQADDRAEPWPPHRSDPIDPINPTDPDNPISDIVVDLSLALTVETCETAPPGEMSSCTIFTPVSCGSLIQLVPDFYTWLYRGFWSQVTMTSNTRYIGVVTIETPFDMGTPAPQPPEYLQENMYYITVEILEDKGVIAKMILNTTDLQNIPRVSLVGPQRQVGWATLTPRLSVSSPEFNCPTPPGSSPIPTPIDPEPLPDAPSSNERLSPQWNVLMGTIKSTK